MNEDFKKLRSAMIEVSKKVPPPDHIWLGEESARFFGFPNAGEWKLNKNGEWECLNDFSK